MPLETLVLITSCGIGILFLPRQYALLIVLTVITLIPMSSITIEDAHFYPNRIILTFGLIRICIRGEIWHFPNFNKVDLMIILWSAILIVTRFIKPRQDVSVILRFADVYDALGLYMLFRFLIRDMEDMKVIFKSFTVIFLIMASGMTYEKITDHNLFSILGGVERFSIIRDGEVRCQGPFAHSILAGTVAGTSIPFFFALLSRRNKIRMFGYIGFMICTLIVFLTASSGPIISFLLALTGLGTWILRNHLRTVRTCIFFSLIFLHFGMKAPVWYLISRIDFTGSSTGWHRSELIDASIRHFDDWWLTGTDYTRNWMPTGVAWSGRHTDITNYYIKNGINGGIAALVLFIMILTSGFSLIGKALKNIPLRNKHYRFIAWAIGCSLFSHTITFFSVCYFDQSQMFFLLNLAMIGCIYNFSILSNSKNKYVRLYQSREIFD